MPGFLVISAFLLKDWRFVWFPSVSGLFSLRIGVSDSPRETVQLLLYGETFRDLARGLHASPFATGVWRIQLLKKLRLPEQRKSGECA